MAKPSPFFLPLAVLAITGLGSRAVQAEDTLKLTATEVFTLKLDAQSQGVFQLKNATGASQGELTPGSQSGPGKVFTLVAPLGGNYQSNLVLTGESGRTLSFSLKGKRFGGPTVSNEKASNPAAKFKFDLEQTKGSKNFLLITAF